MNPMPEDEPGSPRHAVMVMNPRSGGGKVDRFRLAELARAAGAEVRLTGPDDDAASLARAAIADGATVLGVAGGDGSVSAVAAVAAEARRPLIVLPAGTRNHFARDLGLDVRDPASALRALSAGEDLPVVCEIRPGALRVVLPRPEPDSAPA